MGTLPKVQYILMMLCYDDDEYEYDDDDSDVGVDDDDYGRL